MRNDQFNLVDYPQLNDKAITMISQIDNGNIILGTETGLLYQISPNGGIDSLRLPVAEKINCVHETNSGDLWIGTESSLQIYSNEEFFGLDEEFASLYKVSINKIITDKQGIYGSLHLTVCINIQMVIYCILGKKKDLLTEIYKA